MYEANNPVGGLSTGLAIVEQLRETDGARISELAEDLDLTPGAVHHHLSTLREFNFVIQDGVHYRLSLKFKVYGEYVLHQKPVYHIGRREVDLLAEATGEYGHLVTEEHGRSIKLHQQRGEKAIGRDYQQVKRQNMEPMHYTAAGKALLAFFDRGYTEQIISYYGLPQMTSKTVTQPDELYAELDDIRQLGYSVNDEEEIEGIRAVGAPVLDHQGTPVAAVSLSAPAERFTREKIHDEVGATVMETANVIQANLNMQAREDKTFNQLID